MPDYGHALALIRQLERQAADCAAREGQIWQEEAARNAASAQGKAEELEAADWECRECGAVSPTAQQSACEHSFIWDYEMVPPPGTPEEKA